MNEKVTAIVKTETSLINNIVLIILEYSKCYWCCDERLIYINIPQYAERCDLLFYHKCSKSTCVFRKTILNPQYNPSKAFCKFNNHIKFELKDFDRSFQGKYESTEEYLEKLRHCHCVDWKVEYKIMKTSAKCVDGYIFIH